MDCVERYAVFCGCAAALREVSSLNRVRRGSAGSPVEACAGQVNYVVRSVLSEPRTRDSPPRTLIALRLVRCNAPATRPATSV